MNNETETNNYEVSGWIETQISIKVEASSHEEAEAEFFKMCNHASGIHHQAEQIMAGYIGGDNIEFVEGNGPFVSDVSEITEEVDSISGKTRQQLHAEAGGL